MKVAGIRTMGLFSRAGLILLLCAQLMASGAQAQSLGNEDDFRRISKLIEQQNIEVAFEEVKELMPWATSIEVCPAVCSQCDRDAYYTQRIGIQEKQILVGGAESYQPVCWKHSLLRQK